MREIITFRVKSEVRNASKDIPLFRKKLELYAEKLFNDWNKDN